MLRTDGWCQTYFLDGYDSNSDNFIGAFGLVLCSLSRKEDCAEETGDKDGCAWDGGEAEAGEDDRDDA